MFYYLTILVILCKSHLILVVFPFNVQVDFICQYFILDFRIDFCVNEVGLRFLFFVLQLLAFDTNVL